VNLSHGAPRTAPVTDVSDWNEVGVASLKSERTVIATVPFVLVETLGSYHTLRLLRPHLWYEGAIPDSQGMLSGCSVNDWKPF